MKKSLGDWLQVALHTIVGFITGGVAPIVLDRLQSSVSAGVPLTPNGIEATLISAVIGGVLMATYKIIDTSSNALVKQTLENNITPAMLDSITSTVVQRIMSAQASAKTTPTTTNTVKAMLLALMLVGVANAQTTEKNGFGINPSFSAPLQFVEMANGTWVALPSVGLAADIGWKDIITTNGQEGLKYSLGMVLEANIGQAVSGNPGSIANGVIGMEAGYKGINFILGYQGLGDPLAGPGGNRVVLSMTYSLDALIGNWNWF